MWGAGIYSGHHPWTLDGERKVTSSTYVELARCSVRFPMAYPTWGRWTMTLQGSGSADAGTTGELRVVNLTSGGTVGTMIFPAGGQQVIEVIVPQSGIPQGVVVLAIDIRRASGSGTAGFFFRSFRTWMNQQLR